MKNISNKVLVRGGGDLASGIARRLYLAGLYTVITELPHPRAIRRPVSFATAVHEKELTLEGVRAVLCSQLPETHQNFIPVLIDETAETTINTWNPSVIIDARMRKKPPEPAELRDTPFILGIGPYFEVNVNCHAVVETNRGHSLGRVLRHGKAEENTRVPGSVNGVTTERLLRAPEGGKFQSFFEIGETVQVGDKVAEVDGSAIHAAVGGVLRAAIYPGTTVTKGQKVGDIDPRAVKDYCFTISDKSNAVAGGAVEAVLTFLNHRGHEEHEE